MRLCEIEALAACQDGSPRGAIAEGQLLGVVANSQSRPSSDIECPRLPATKLPLVLGGEPLLCAAYGVTVSLSSYLPRSLAFDRGAGSKSRAALRSSLRRLRAVLAQVQNNERVLSSATVPGRIVQASQGAAQMTATPCRMGVPAPLSRQVPEPAARPQCAASGRRAPERRD
jgi:hypothetical protein